MQLSTQPIGTIGFNFKIIWLIYCTSWAVLFYQCKTSLVLPCPVFKSIDYVRENAVFRSLKFCNVYFLELATNLVYRNC
jgi:hypothetical protein